MAGDAILMLPHDPRWSRRFAREGARLLRLFAGAALGVHHVGSTAVPGLDAKPVLDVLLVGRDLAALDARRGRLEADGYRWLGEHGLPRRRYLEAHRRERGSVHVHAFAAGDPEIARHLDFRDYLLHHPQRAAANGSLKRRLAARYGADRAGYSEAKTAFIRETEALARAWRAATGAPPPAAGGDAC